MNRPVRWTRTIVIAVAVLALCASCVSGGAPLFGGYTPPIEGSEAVSSLEYIELGGVRQLVLLRGKDRRNPILLYLHGGPGNPAIPLEHCMRSLEDSFVVAFWDQRGAGRSSIEGGAAACGDIDTYLSDCDELVSILLRRFGKEKLYLIGHSWGSVIGARFAALRPELLHAYIGIGQVVNWAEQESISHAYALVRAQEEGNEKAIRELEEAAPPYQNSEGGLDYKAFMKERTWLGHYGGISHAKAVDDASGIDESLFFACTEYSLCDLARIKEGARVSIEALWPSLWEIDMERDVPEIDVPVFFFMGAYDYNTPNELARRYFDALVAPRGKAYVAFENSAHVLVLEEPERFERELLDIVEKTRIESIAPR